MKQKVTETLPKKQHQPELQRRAHQEQQQKTEQEQMEQYKQQQLLEHHEQQQQQQMEHRWGTPPVYRLKGEIHWGDEGQLEGGESQRSCQHKEPFRYEEHDKQEGRERKKETGTETETEKKYYLNRLHHHPWHGVYIPHHHPSHADRLCGVGPEGEGGQAVRKWAGAKHLLHHPHDLLDEGMHLLFHEPQQMAQREKRMERECVTDDASECRAQCDTEEEWQGPSASMSVGRQSRVSVMVQSEVRIRV